MEFRGAISSHLHQLGIIDHIMTWLEEEIGVLNSKLSFSVRLVLTEAISNSIRHGNREIVTNSVEIVCWIDEDQLLQVRITDKGLKQFPEIVPNPLEEEKLCNEGGRGVYLMCRYAKEIEYNKEDKCLKIAMNLS